MTDPVRARAGLVEALRATGCGDAVLAAFAAVPRHRFLPDHPVAVAYADDAVPTRIVDGAATSSASQPTMVAIMLDQLDVRPGQRVLEIGTGTGYNAALLAHLGARVTSIDIDEELVASAADHLAGIAEVDLRVGDGALGVPDAAPYDRIVLTVGSWDVRPEWVAQLAPGGRLLLPLTVRGSQLSVAFDLGPDGVLGSDSVVGCAFIRLRGLGAGPAATEEIGPGWTAQVAEGATPDLGLLARHLTDPGDLLPIGEPLTGADVWDGVGLWLMLTAPGTVRLLTDRADAPPGSWFVPTGPGRSTVALTGPGGCAALVVDPPGVRGFGPGGAAVARRLVGCLDGWVAAGRPHASDLRILAVPSGADLPGPGVVVEKEHTRLIITRAW
ncbi:methyltransferase domain-containing protein [Pseudonocardia oroxyli]|uniref:Protein-L-isoaspartate O-methyltransferase n=1 Tax=Pseudonocardia oroxyli TaxID=366584 RepID=A0A1G7W9A3_PSEOR|nr:methyltransferase domain-containing protein [Pseudonocardia oroxyli]SDG67680.1 protein-L-isoaspartate(D-aspartate) O-methyltransferase [Pseudonocardia oroxyli]